MKKAILTLIGLFLFSGWAYAQVLADFEKDDGGFVSGWGNSITSIGKVADPSGKSQGVLAVNVDLSVAGDKKAAFKKSKLDATKAKMIAYYVFLPANTPDSLLIKVWNQGPGWKWQDVKYLAKDVPKQVWYPLYFDFVERHIADANFDASSAVCEEGGIEIYGADLKGTSASWSGKVYVDNVSFLGAEPVLLGDFESNESGFVKGWGDALLSATKITDPTSKSKGVLQLDVDASLGDKKAAIKKSKIDATKATTVSYLIWLPKDTPDGITIKVWMQGPGWNWNDVKIDSKNIKKEVWFPIHFDLPGTAAKNSGFTYTSASCEEGGIELYFADLTAPNNTWKGKILIDNASLYGTETGAKWVVANFEAAAAGTQGFAKWWSTPPFVDLAQSVVDSKGVLRLGVDFSKASASGDFKAAIAKGNVSISSKDPVAVATKITLDVFVPAELPVGGQVGIIVNGPEGGWNEAAWQVVDTAKSTLQIERGKWQTISQDITALLAGGSLASAQNNVTVGVQVYYPSAGTYKGNFLFDNLTVVGIPEPQGTVVSPKSQGKVVDYTLASGLNYQYIRFDWVDNTLGTETYNIYVSDKEITDLKAANVKKIIDGIPHGMQKYGWRPWSNDGTQKTYYFAITSFDGINETALLSDCKVGPLTVTSTKTFKVPYVKDFANKFVLDGLDDEFTNYKSNMVTPESGTYEVGTDTWASNSTDMNFKATMVIDDKYLYISAEVIDDDLRTDSTQQAWEGDALEFYMGLYDNDILKETHKKNFDAANGDYRIGFNALGLTTRDGGSPVTINGVEATVFQKFSGDGYIIEARIDLNKLAANGKFLLNNGMKMPFRIDGNDWDPSKGDTKRSLIVQAGGMPTGTETGLTDENWKRPDAWGYLEVTGAPTVGIEEESSLPTEYALYNNYPNPFNPTTTIKYDLPKESIVGLKIYDILGREVMTLVNEKQKAGYYQINFNASKLASGVYIYRIIADGFVQTKKMMLLK